MSVQLILIHARVNINGGPNDKFYSGQFSNDMFFLRNFVACLSAKSIFPLESESFRGVANVRRTVFYIRFTPEQILFEGPMVDFIQDNFESFV